MNYTIDPFALITKNGNTYCFVGATPEKTLALQLNPVQEKYIEAMKSGAFISIDELCTVFAHNVIGALVSLGFLTDKQIDTQSIYSRTDAFFRTYNMPEARNRLSGKSVLILGCGGIGTHMAWHMATVGVGKITLLDFDTVEQSNLNRQLLFDNNDVGKIKVEVLREKLHRINPNVIIDTICEKISSEQQLESICLREHYDLIIKSLDSPASFPIWLDHVCKRNRLTYIAGITMRDNALIGPSFIPSVSEAGWSDLVKLPQTSEKVNGSAPSIGAMLYHISDELAVEALKILTGYGKLKYTGKVVFRNIFTNEEHTVEAQPSERAGKPAADGAQTSSGKSLILSILLMAAISFLPLVSKWLYPAIFAAALLLPFYLYKKESEIVRCTFIFSAVVSAISFITVTRGGMLSAFAANAAQLSLIGIIVFCVLSLSMLLMCAFSYAVCRVLSRKKR